MSRPRDFVKDQATGECSYCGDVLPLLDTPSAGKKYGTCPVCDQEDFADRMRADGFDFQVDYADSDDDDEFSDDGYDIDEDEDDDSLYDDEDDY